MVRTNFAEVSVIVLYWLFFHSSNWVQYLYSKVQHRYFLEVSFSIKMYYFLGYFAIYWLNSKLQNYCLSVPSWKNPLLKTVTYKWSVIPPGSSANLNTLDPNYFFQSCTVFCTSFCNSTKPGRETRRVLKETLKMASEGKVFSFDIV